MKVKDLKEGKYYHITQTGSSGKWIIWFNKLKREVSREMICTRGSLEYTSRSLYVKPNSTGNWGYEDYIQELRPCTKREINWLKACLQHKKFIPNPLIITDLL